MAIAAKLSRKLHEVFGTEAAEAMVDWMDEVDGNRAELRELNDLSFARFDSRLERIAEVIARLDTRIAEVNARLDTRIAEVNGRMDAGFAQMRAEMHAFKAELIKWMFLFWAGSALASLLRR